MIKLLLAALIAACTGHHQAAAADASVDASPVTRKLVVIAGQSNAGRPALVSELTDPTVADPYPAIQIIDETGTDTNPPTVLVYPLGDLSAHPNLAGAPGFGIELTLGRTLDQAQPGVWSIARFAFGSTALGGEWQPFGGWPTGQPNLFTQFNTFVHDAEDQTGAKLAALIWIQGESDAPTVALGQEYGIRLAEFFGAERMELQLSGEVPFIYGRLNVWNPQAGTPYVRAGQEAVENDDNIMVDQDSYQLRPDLTHYTTQAVLDLGTRYGQAVLAATQ